MTQIITKTDFIKLTFSKAKTLLTYELPDYLPINDPSLTIDFNTIDQFLASFNYIYEFDESPLQRNIILEKRFPSYRIQIKGLLQKIELTQSFIFTGNGEYIPNKCVPASKLIEVIINEVRNPIVGLLATSDLYLNYGKEFELDHVEYFGITRNYAQNLSRFIDQIIYLLKLENKEISYSDSPIHAKTIIRNFEKTCSASNVECKLDFEKTVNDDAFFVGNEELIQIAVKNILLNAIQYGKPDRVIKIKSVLENNLIGISVTDFGFGIKPENGLSILESFSRQKLENKKNNPDGIGIGLSLVSEIMLHQKGKLIIKSNKQIGCEVLLLFPRLTLPITESSNQI